LEESQIAFDGFVLDPLNGRLTEKGREVPLRPQSFEVLMLLARNSGQLVTKDRLFGEVWPKTVVTDDALVQCIRDIRVALGDDAQRLVRTLPRRGYLFTPAVRRVGEVPADASVTQVSAPSRKRRWAAVAALGIGVLLAGTAALVPGFFPRPSSMGEDAAAPLSIVVLPLTDLNGDPEQAYFAEGLTEDLTIDLSRIPGSFVIARSSADSWRGKAADAREVGQQLGVRYILEGSVQRLNDKVRLNLQLVDARSGHALWAERFDGGRADMASLQQQVTGTIARSLHLQLIEAESARARRERPTNPQAQDLALQGWSLYERRTPESVAAASELLRRSVAMDASSAFAWSLLSDCYTADLLNRWLHLRQASRAEWLALGSEAAAKAYALDPNNLYALEAQATVLQLAGRPEDGLALLQREVSLNPNYAPAWHRISYAQLTLGNPKASIDAGEKAIRLSPRDGRLYSFYVVMAAAFLHTGHDREALDWARRSAQERADFGTAQAWIAASAALLGEMDAAHNAVSQFRRLQPGYSISSFRAENLSGNVEYSRQHERFYEGLRKAGLAE
jgi:TolB-like protein/DNA-binding winged helix-turn-helix (wHTH) protein